MGFHYSSQSISAQTNTNGNFVANAGVKMLFFDRALSVTLKASDIFNTSRNNSNSIGTNFYSKSSTSEKAKIFSLYISYFFQSIANEEIDDNMDVQIIAMIFN